LSTPLLYWLKQVQIFPDLSNILYPNRCNKIKVAISGWISGYTTIPPVPEQAL
jgi:hypothetical protein